MTEPFIRIEANESGEGVMGFPKNNYQLSLIAALLSYIIEKEVIEFLRKGDL